MTTKRLKRLLSSKKCLVGSRGGRLIQMQRESGLLGNPVEELGKVKLSSRVKLSHGAQFPKVCVVSRQSTELIPGQLEELTLTVLTNQSGGLDPDELKPPGVPSQ